MSATTKAWPTRINGYIFQLRSLFDWDGCYLGSFRRLCHLVVGRTQPRRRRIWRIWRGYEMPWPCEKGLCSPLCSDFPLRKIHRSFRTKKNGLDLLVDLAGSERIRLWIPRKRVGVCCSPPVAVGFQMEVRKAKHRWSVRTCHFHYISWSYSMKCR